jgi:hypothetical protein
MASFTLKIKLDNDAFADPQELPYLIHKVATRISDGAQQGAVLDTNGNAVGEFNVGKRRS